MQLALEVTGTMGKQRKRTVIQLPRVFAVDRFPDLKNSVVAPSDMKGWNHINDINVPRLGDSIVNLQYWARCAQSIGTTRGEVWR